MTSGDEEVFIGEQIGEAVIVHVKCNNCTCLASSTMTCTTEACDVDCQWLEWGEWGVCSKDCDVGQRLRSRTFTPAQYDGELCDGSGQQLEDCNIEPCEECTWSAWADWTSCSAECYGSKSRSRNCTNLPAGGTQECCSGTPLETESCNTETCLGECENTTKVWTTNEEDCSCPMTCANLANPGSCVQDDVWSDRCCCPLGQVEDYQGVCVDIEDCPCIYEGVTYPADEVITKECETCTCESGLMNCTPIPCDCVVGEWGVWGECDKPCDGGEKHRYREVVAGIKGPDCPPLNDTELCNQEPCVDYCEDLDGNLYQKSEIVNQTECRECMCNENLVIECYSRPGSDINGGWRPWTEFGSCSSTCDGGVKRRTRLCDSPLPACNGAECEGDAYETEPCNEGVPCVTTTGPTPTTPSDCYDKVFDYGSFLSGAILGIDASEANKPENAISYALLGAPSDAYYKASTVADYPPTYEIFLDASPDFTLISITFDVKKVTSVIIEVPNLDDGTVYTTEVTELDPNGDTVVQNLDVEGNSIKLTFTLDNKDVTSVKLSGLMIEATDCYPCGLNEEYTSQTCEMPCEALLPDAASCYTINQNCACLEGLFRDSNGNCVNSTTCGYCTINGVQYPHGTIIDDPENCQKYVCDEGSVITHNTTCTPCQTGYVRAPTADDCCRCEPTPTGQGEKCRLQVLTDSFSVTTPEGKVCRSAEIDLSYCSGACDSNDHPTITFNDIVYEHQVSCKCCKGDGQEQSIELECEDGTKTTAKIYQMTTCGCEACGEQAVLPYEPEECDTKVYDFSNLNSQFSLSGTAAKEGFALSGALDGSGTWYKAEASSPDPWYSPEGVSLELNMPNKVVFVSKVEFIVSKAANVTVELMYKEDHEAYTYESEVVSADGYTVTKPFDNLKAEQVRLRFNRSTDTSSVRVEGLKMTVKECS